MRRHTYPASGSVTPPALRELGARGGRRPRCRQSRQVYLGSCKFRKARFLHNSPAWPPDPPEKRTGAPHLRGLPRSQIHLWWSGVSPLLPEISAVIARATAEMLYQDLVFNLPGARIPTLWDCREDFLETANHHELHPPPPPVSAPALHWRGDLGRGGQVFLHLVVSLAHVGHGATAFQDFLADGTTFLQTQRWNQEEMACCGWIRQN